MRIGSDADRSVERRTVVEVQDHHRAILGTVKTVVLAVARLLQERVSGRLKLH